MLSYADHLGEKLAWFFGITSPKYYYELEEFKKMQEEEEARKEKLDAEMHGWASKEEVDQVVETAPSGDAGIWKLYAFLKHHQRVFQYLRLHRSRSFYNFDRTHLFEMFNNDLITTAWHFIDINTMWY